MIALFDILLTHFCTIKCVNTMLNYIHAYDCVIYIIERTGTDLWKLSRIYSFNFPVVSYEHVIYLLSFFYSIVLITFVRIKWFPSVVLDVSELSFLNNFWLLIWKFDIHYYFGMVGSKRYSSKYFESILMRLSKVSSSLDETCVWRTTDLILVFMMMLFTDWAMLLLADVFP